jgi:Flp pilus assembly pilin Flp
LGRGGAGILGEPGKELEMLGKFVKRFIRSEVGAAMVEYAIALLVAAALGTGVFTALGTNAVNHANAACTAMGTAFGNSCP